MFPQNSPVLSYSDVLKNIRVTERWQVLGKHKGLAFYTIGQRKGIELPGGPYYVLKKDLKRNALIVTRDEKDLYKKELIAENVNWISGKEPKLPPRLKAKIRYRHKTASARIVKLETRNVKHKIYKVIFDRSQRAITPGQSVVFYSPRSSPKAMVRGKGEEVLGGGIIT